MISTNNPSTPSNDPMAALRGQINLADQRIILCLKGRFEAGDVAFGGQADAVVKGVEHDVSPQLTRVIYDEMALNWAGMAGPSMSQATLQKRDEALVLAIHTRQQLQEPITKVKLAHNIPMVVPERVEQVIESAVTLGKSMGLPQGFTRKVYTALIDDAHARQGVHREKADLFPG